MQTITTKGTPRKWVFQFTKTNKGQDYYMVSKKQLRQNELLLTISTLIFEGRNFEILIINTDFSKLNFHALH